MCDKIPDITKSRQLDRQKEETGNPVRLRPPFLTGEVVCLLERSKTIRQVKLPEQ